MMTPQGWNQLEEDFAATLPKTIAVLPFKILGGASERADEKVLSIGLADALITRLSNVQGLTVRPTGSILRYDSKDADSFMAGADLDVGFILDGNIHRTEKRIRISVQLLNVADQTLVWAERFDEDFTDLLSLEEAISTKVVASLLPQLKTDERPESAQSGTDQQQDDEAHLPEQSLPAFQTRAVPKKFEQNESHPPQAEAIRHTSESKRRLPLAFRYALAIVLLAFAAYGLYQFSLHSIFRSSIGSTTANELWSNSFASKMSVKQLTTSGKALIAAVSPDGEQVAFVVKEGEAQSLWIRQVNSEDAKQLVAPDAVLFAGLTFSPDGQDVYYTAWSHNYIARNLYRVPATGTSAPQLMMEQVNSGIGFAPDGKRFAFSGYDPKTRQSFLRLAELDADGAISSTRSLVAYTQPDFIRANPSFAPDGKKIAYIIGSTIGKKDYMNLFVFDLATNGAAKIGARAFGDVSGIAWRDDASEIVLSAAERDGLPYQLWAFAYPSGEATQLNNDSSSYFNVSIARDSAALVTAKREKSSAVWLANLSSTNEANANGKQLTNGTDRLDGMSGVSWTPDNQILYVGGTGAQYSLMLMNADGTNARAVEVNVVNPMFPSLTKDKRYIIFADTKEQGSVVWRYDTKSGVLTQLSPNYAVTPALTPDNRFVIYSSYNAARKLSLHKMLLAGGDEMEITSALSLRPVVSPDGRWIACYLNSEQTNGTWQLTVLSSDDGAVRRVITPPDTFNLQTPMERPLAWSPDSRALFYLNDKSDVSNIFRIFVETDSAPEKITNFTSGRIFDFSLSPDSKRAVIARGATTSDIVIFGNSEQLRSS